MSKIGWMFPPNNGGKTDGPNNGGRDAFSGARLSSMVRETVQNSIDARSGSEPTEIYFKLVHVKKSEFPGFSEIKEHIERSKVMAAKQNLKKQVQIYDQAINEIDKKGLIPVLCIHDANTNGLKGPIDEPYGSWSALTKGEGLSQKNDEASLGSFGHGSNAPISMSLTNQVFYLSNIIEDNKSESRFIGKCSLQTHKNVNDKLTQGTGFYGKLEDEPYPLVDNVINIHASWAHQMRNDWKNNEVGTSIYVPYTSFNEGLYPETVITVVANFFYAIQNGDLVVQVDNIKIEQNNIEGIFYEYKPKLENEKDDIDVDHIKDCFETITTILSPTNKKSEAFDEFGTVDWYIRVDEEISSKSVGIARHTGMLITSNPERLKHFPNCKNFNMFVCVRGKEGSEVLRSAENPQHNQFEFDRIEIESEKKEAERKYKKFATKLRDIIRKYAPIESEDESSPFNFNFDDIMSTNKNQPVGKDDRGSKLLLTNTTLANPSFIINPKPDKKTAPNKYYLNNLRVLHEGDLTASINGDSDVEGWHEMIVNKRGETDSESLKLKDREIINKNKKRMEHNVAFENKADDLALECYYVDLCVLSSFDAIQEHRMLKVVWYQCPIKGRGELLICTKHPNKVDNLSLVASATSSVDKGEQTFEVTNMANANIQQPFYLFKVLEVDKNEN